MKFKKALFAMMASGILVCLPLVGLSAEHAQSAQQSLCVKPVVCVTLPPVTKTVTLPRATATKTVTRAIPGPVSTVTLVKSAPPITRTVTSTQTGSTGQTTTLRATVTSPPVTSTVTVTTPPKVVTNEKVVTVTVSKAIGLSLGLVVLGVLVGVLLLWLAYARGYLSSENENVRGLTSLRDSLKK